MTSSSGLNNRRLDITDPIHCQIVKWHLVGRHVVSIIHKLYGAITIVQEYTIDVRRGYNSTTTRQLIRRYSQFASLNRRLAHDGRGMQFPSFPPKKLVGNTNTTFVASRALALQTFLDNITSHPIIYASEMVLEFFDLLQVDAQSKHQNVQICIFSPFSSQLRYGVDEYSQSGRLANRSPVEMVRLACRQTILCRPIGR
jgi:hypothetical protein